MTARRLVTVFRSRDAAELSAMAEVLRREGLTVHLASVPQTGLFGGLGDDGRLDVPEESEERALDLLSGHLGEVEPPPELADDDSWKDELAAERMTLRPVLAAGMVIFCASHFYARRVFTGLLLWLGQGLAFWTMANGNFTEAATGSLLSVAILVYDLVGGQVAVRAYNRGRRRGPVPQLLTSLLVLAGLGTLCSLIGPPLAARVRARHADRFEQGRWSHQDELRGSGTSPSRLPFPFHLDFGRR